MFITKAGHAAVNISPEDYPYWAGQGWSTTDPSQGAAPDPSQSSGGGGGGTVDSVARTQAQTNADAIAALPSTYVPKLAKADAASAGTATASTTKPNLLDISAGNATRNLPAANSVPAGTEVYAKVTAATDPANPTTSASIAPAGADTINGVAGSLTMRVKNRAKRLVSDGVSNWLVLGGDVDTTVEEQRNDSRYTTSLGQFELQPQIGYAHSWYAVDSNATPGTRIPHRLASRMRMSGVTIRAVSGYLIGDISNLALAGALAWTPRTKALVTAVCTINDVTIGKGTAPSRRGYVHAWRSLLSLLCANAVIAANTAQFVYSANWSSETVGVTSTQAASTNSTGGARFTTTTTGAYTEFTYTDDGNGVDVVLVARAAGAGLATATIGGTTVGTLDLTATVAQDCTAILRVRGQSAGTKTVRVTHTSGASLTVDSYRLPSSAPVPILVFGEPPVTPSPTDYANWLTDLIAYKADLAAIVTEFPTAVFCDLDTALFDNATMLVTDSNGGRKHPNDKGCAYIASQGFKALATLPYLLGLNITTSASAYPAAYTAPAVPAIPSGGQDGTGASSGGATAPGAPTAVTATAGAGQATVAWTAPSSNGGSAITDYVIQYRTTAGPGAWTTFADGTSTATSATVTGLTNGTGYDFQVAAVNAIGQGAYSSTASATPSAGAATVTSGYTHRHVASSDAAAAGAVTQSWANGGTSTTPFTAASGTTGPTKRIVSSKHYFEFDGVDDQMTRGAGVARPLTVAMVVRFRTTGSSGALNRGTADQIGKSSGNSPYVSNGTLLSSGATDDQKFHIMTFVNNGDGTGSVQIDGGTPVTGSIGSNTAIATSSTFMGRSTSGTAFFQIDVAEEIEWPSALTSGQIANTVTALQTAYSGLLGT